MATAGVKNCCPGAISAPFLEVVKGCSRLLIDSGKPDTYFVVCMAHDFKCYIATTIGQRRERPAFITCPLRSRHALFVGVCFGIYLNGNGTR